MEEQLTGTMRGRFAMSASAVKTSQTDVTLLIDFQ